MPVHRCHFCFPLNQAERKGAFQAFELIRLNYGRIIEIALKNLQVQKSEEGEALKQIAAELRILGKHHVLPFSDLEIFCRKKNPGGKDF